MRPKKTPRQIPGRFLFGRSGVRARRVPVLLYQRGHARRVQALVHKEEAQVFRITTMVGFQVVARKACAEQRIAQFAVRNRLALPLQRTSEADAHQTRSASFQFIQSIQLEPHIFGLRRRRRLSSSNCATDGRPTEWGCERPEAVPPVQLKGKVTYFYVWLMEELRCTCCGRKLAQIVGYP